MANVIDSLNLNDNKYYITLPYGTCSTAAATAAKTVTVNNFALDTSARIVVKFTVTNTASSPTLNVNGTGAKAIYYRGSAISASYLAANHTYEFIYNGTQWELIGDINTNTDTKVTQTATTSDASYPLLLAPSGQTATTTTTSYFDSGVTLNPSTNTIVANVSGNAATATKLATARTIILSGDVTGSATFDGSANATITATVVDDSHNHAASNITSGTLSSDRLPTVPISKGGTGQTTGEAAANALINSLSTEGSTPTDDDFYVAQYAGGGTTNTSYRRRPVSALWNYIKSKLATVATSGSYDDLSNKPNYAGSSSAGGAATSANKLNTNAGDSNTPVYFSSGVPVACTSLDLNTTGSAAKLTTAKKISLSGDVTGYATFDGSNDIIISTSAIPFISGTQTAATGSWTGTASQFDSLKDGQVIHYWLPYNGSGNATLNLTLKDGTTTGAIACYRYGASRITTHYPAGSVITLTYREGVSIAGSSTTYTGWWSDADYSSSTASAVQYTGTIKCGTTAITSGNIIVGKDGVYTHLKSGSDFDITYPILYAASSISASSTSSNCYSARTFTVTATQSITLTAYTPVYIKGNLNGTIFTPVSTTPLTQTVPTSADGYEYILLGVAYSTTSMYLLSEHPIFAYKGNAFGQISSKSITDLSVSGRTITYTRADGSTGTITTQDNNTTYSAGTGLSLSGTTFNHSNSVTAATISDGGSARTLAFGGTFKIPSITYDAQGHITGTSTTTLTMPANPNSDTKVNVTLGTTTKAYLLGTSTTPTSTATGVTAIADTGVYLDTTAGKLTATSFSGSGAALTSLNASNISSGTLAAARLPTVTQSPTTSTASPSHSGTFTVIGGVTTDSYGRVTGVDTKTVTLPADNNTDTKVTQTAVTASSYSNFRPLIFGSSNSSTEGFTPSSVTDQVYSTNVFYVQPSTGTLAATTFKGALSGNATTATTLATARTINGTSFNGSANITTANWGTARNISIADSDATNTGTAVSVNGSAAATLKLPATIKASLTGNATTATTLATARTLTIGRTGKTFNGSANVSWTLAEIGAVPLAGGTMSGNLNFSNSNGAIAWNGGSVHQRIQTTDDNTSGTNIFAFQQSLDTGSTWADLLTIKDNGEVVASKFTGSLSGNASTATALTTTSAGSATQPTYFSSGKPVACTYTLGKSVPSDAVFTDTKNTAGSSNTSNKIYLIGATDQGTYYTTYSHDTAYVGTDGCLYSGGSKVLTSHQTVSNSAPTLSWGTTSTVGTVGGVALTVKMPSNPNTDTHYTTGINAGASGATSNSAASDPYITVKDNSTYRSQIRLVGSGATAVSSDSNGNITISSTNTTYSAGTGLSLSSTTFSVNTGFTTSGKNYKVAVDTTSGGLYVNVPWTNTTYSAATTSAAGLMSAADKVKLDGITDSADSVSFSRSLTSGTKIGTITINGTGTDLYCQTDTNTVYYAGTGISLSGTTFSNAGVRSITTGSSQGTISVNTNGTSAEVSVSGLNTAAYYSYSTFALANHTHSNYFSTSGGTISGATTISSTATYPFSIVNNTNTIFKVNKVGQTYADGAYYATGADYAEYMEWNDQNSLDQDRRGLFVVMEYDTGLIRLANEEDDVDDIIGIVSGTPSTVGNSAEMHWCKKYVTDVFGNVQMETIVQPKYVDKYGNTIPEQTIEVPLLNPEYDPNIEYIPRSKRKEWVVIGLMGQIIMVDDGTCVVGRRCRNTTNGMATLSETKEGWRVIERLDENHIRVLFK